MYILSVIKQKQVIRVPKKERFDFLIGQKKLFEDIDINGDGLLEWNEFTQYIVDSLLNNKKKSLMNVDNDDVEQTDIQIVEKAYFSSNFRFFHKKTQIDNINHKSLIRKVLFNKTLKLFLVIYENQGIIRSINQNFQEVFEKTIDIQKRLKTHENICIQDIALSADGNTVGIVTEDRLILLYNFSKECFISIKKLDQVQYSIFYIDSSKTWLTNNTDNVLRFWCLSNFEDQLEYDAIVAHQDQITSIIDYTKYPNLMITTSMDGYIRVWNVQTLKMRVEYKISHTLASKCPGVRCMLYSKNCDNLLLYWGFSSLIILAELTSNFGLNIIGKQEGHSAIIETCAIMSSEQFCVSLDLKNNLRVWSLKDRSTIQTINNELMPGKIHMIIALPNADHFALTGRKLFYYSNSQSLSKIHYQDPDNIPIDINFNPFFNTFVVTTNKDTRCYSAFNGRLCEVLLDERFLDKTYGHISSMCLGGSNRKFYLGDESGCVRLYNLKTGQVLKIVNNTKEEHVKFRHFYNQFIKKKSMVPFNQASNKKLDVIQGPKSQLKRESSMILNMSKATIHLLGNPKDNNLLKESSNNTIATAPKNCNDEFEYIPEEDIIVKMLYIPEQKLLIAGTFNSIIKIYDEEETENSYLLRYFVGGHMGSEITALAYSNQYNVLVSGSRNGIVSIWDFQSGKYETSFFEHSRKITGLGFCGRYPILLTSSKDGSQCFWGLKQIQPNVYIHKCIFKLVNQFTSDLKNDGNLCCGIKKSFFEGYFGYPIIGKQDDIYEDHKVVLSPLNVAIGAEDKSKLRESYPNNVITHRFEKSSVQKNMIARTHFKPTQNSTMAVLAEMKMCSENKQQLTQMNMKYVQELESRIEKEFKYSIIGDHDGNVSIYHMNYLFENRKLEQFDGNVKDGPVVKRNDCLFVGSDVKSIQIKHELNVYKPFIIDANAYLRISKWKAHKGSIVDMKMISHMHGLMTSGKDKHIKVWSYDGELWGDIDMLALGVQDPVIQNKWNFPFNWVERLTDVLNEVLYYVGKIDGVEYEQDHKDNLINEYLNHKYFLPAFKDQIMACTKKIGEITKFEKNLNNLKKIIKDQDKFVYEKDSNRFEKTSKVKSQESVAAEDLVSLSGNNKSPVTKFGFDLNGKLDLIDDDYDIFENNKSQTLKKIEWENINRDTTRTSKVSKNMNKVFQNRSNTSKNQNKLRLSNLNKKSNLSKLQEATEKFDEVKKTKAIQFNAFTERRSSGCGHKISQRPQHLSGAELATERNLFDTTKGAPDDKALDKKYRISGVSTIHGEDGQNEDYGFFQMKKPNFLLDRRYSQKNVFLKKDKTNQQKKKQIKTQIEDQNNSVKTTYGQLLRKTYNVQQPSIMNGNKSSDRVGEIFNEIDLDEAYRYDKKKKLFATRKSTKMLKNIANGFSQTHRAFSIKTLLDDGPLGTFNG